MKNWETGIRTSRIPTQNVLEDRLRGHISSESHAILEQKYTPDYIDP